MTMGIGFIVGDSVFLAADKRSSGYDIGTKEFSNIVSDNSQKIIVFDENTALFIGGLAIIGDEIKNNILDMAHNNEIYSIKQLKGLITEICQKGHGLFKDLLNTMCCRGIGSITVIMAMYDKEQKKPVLIGFTDDNNFEPVEYHNNFQLLVKSTNDELVSHMIKNINSSMPISYYNTPMFFKQTFSEVSKIEKPISAECDILEINRKGIFKMEGANKNIKSRILKDKLLVANLITAGKLKAITVEGCTVIGNSINGGTIAGAAITGGTITGAIINGATINGGVINVDSDIHIGKKLYINPSDYGAGLDWGNGVNEVYIDPASKAIFVCGKSVYFVTDSGSYSIEDIQSNINSLVTRVAALENK